MRAEGYYWVKALGKWTIEEWDGTKWNDHNCQDGNAYYISFFEEIDERRIERGSEQYGPSPITVIKRAFDAGMSAATYNGRPGMPDAPQFEEWYSKWHKKT